MGVGLTHPPAVDWTRMRGHMNKKKQKKNQRYMRFTTRYVRLCNNLILKYPINSMEVRWEVQEGTSRGLSFAESGSCPSR